MSGFGLDHLPYGVVGGHCVVRYEDHVLDLSTVPGLPPVFDQASLNPFIALGRPAWEDVREKVTRVLEAGTVELQAVYEPELPVAIGDFVDFYSSLEHATTVGKRFRPDDPLPPAWRALPIGYHGRAGSVVVTGTPIVRPHGLRPSFGPTEQLDFELELGFITGPGKHLGDPIPAADVRDHVFGFVLVNDWSARDLQAFEYRPLGPFLGKSFATSMSAWITPLAALDPYRVSPSRRTPSPRTTCAPTATGRSTSSSRSTSTARSSPAATRARCTGRSPSSSRTRRSTARRCGRETCSPRARSPASRPAPRAACWRRTAGSSTTATR